MHWIKYKNKAGLICDGCCVVYMHVLWGRFIPSSSDISVFRAQKKDRKGNFICELQINDKQCNSQDQNSVYKFPPTEKERAILRNNIWTDDALIKTTLC